MVKPDVFAVEFDEWGIYAPGDSIAGRVIVHTREQPLHVDQLLVQICGAARVFWSQKELVPRTLTDDDLDDSALAGQFYPQNRVTSPKAPKKQVKTSKQPVQMRSVAYANDKIYFDERQTLWQVHNPGNHEEEDARVRQMYHHAQSYRLKLHNIVSYDDDARIDAILDAADRSVNSNNNAALFPLGKHEFPFTFTLPDDIPTAFDGANNHCSIRYFVKAQLMHFNTCKYTRKEHFAVVRPYDLNQMPAVARPLTIDGFVEGAGTGGCRSQEASINMKVHLARRAYVPGEKLDITVHINNEWYCALKHIKLSLVQLVECHGFNANTGRLHSKSEETKLLSVVEPTKVRQHSGEHIWCPSVYVPAVTPTLVSESELITVEYALECSIFGRDKRTRLLHLTTPIIIGTVRLSDLPPQAIPGFPEAFGKHRPLPLYKDLVKSTDSQSVKSDSWISSPDAGNAPPPYEQNLIELN